MKKLSFLFALLCASMMAWADWTGQVVGHVTNVWLDGIGSNENRTEFDYAVNYLTEYDNGILTITIDYATENFDKIVGLVPKIIVNGAYAGDFVAKQWSSSSYAAGSTLSIYFQFDYNGGGNGSSQFQYTIPSGGTPDPAPADPNEYTAGGHTIHLDASFVGDIYTLVITSTDDMEGLGGSFWNVNGVGADMRTNTGTSSYTVSGDKKTITCQVQSTSAPNIYTPLYVLMPGEVNFGNVTLNWVDLTPINSEYCNYQDPQTLKNGKNIALTWETDGSGNVVITMQPGTGTTSCSFRNGGFEGGIGAFVVSDDDFVTTTPASDYFTAVQVYSGNTYTLTKVADLPANAKIKHVGSGHALAWVLDGNNEYCFPDFIYTYGGTCNQLDAPTNVAIDANNIITFDAVTGAGSYTAYVHLGGVLKYSQVVVSGDELTFTPLEDGAYDVTVVASGAGKTDSDPSTAFVWNLTAAPVVLGNSEYCEHLMQTGTNTEAAFTWETDGSGNIVITISETLGGAASATHFRNNALAIGNFKVGAGQADGANYFSHPGTTTGNQLVLTATTAPALGEKIYYHGVVEYATSGNGDAWPTLDFEWTYGTVCSGKAVSASVNNNTMGSAVVKQGDVEVTSVESGTSVTFIATVADNELYRFVNWTKGGVEVSTNATYTTTITETTNLVANFDYIRNTYCHAEILSNESAVTGKKLYMTLGSIGGGQYQIKFEGSAEAPLTALNNANYVVNGVTALTDVDGQNKTGNDVPFTAVNGRWTFDASGYGSARMIFELADGRTIDDIFVWGNAIYFATAAGELGYVDNQTRLGLFGNPAPLRHNIAWNSTCSDAEAPVFDKAEAEVLSETSVQLKIQATDNWGGLLTYTIARAGAEPIISNHASGEEFTQDVTGLTAGTQYDFTVTVSDGVNNANTHILVTPEGDNTKPIMGTASLESKTWHSAIINVAATDNKGVTAYYVVEKDADYVAAEGKITVDGLTASTEYTLHIKAKDAAGNISDNQAEVSFTTDAHSLVPTIAAPVPTWPDDQVISFYSDKYEEPSTWNYRAPWGGNTVYEQVVIAENNVIHYSSFDWAGWEINSGAPYNALTMEKLHLDIWVENDCEIGIVPIYGGAGLVTDDTRRVKRALLGQQWNSIDLVLATDYAELNLASIFQFKFDQATTTEFYLDNVYFYRESAVVDDDAPYNVSGNMASQSYFSVTLALSATDDSGAVTYIIKNGDAQVASTSGASDATVNVKIDNLASGTDYVFSVIAKDGSDNAADAINVNASTLAAPAPAPTPTHTAAAVKSLYSNSYTPVVAVENYCEWWWDAPTVHTNRVLGADDNVLFYDNNHAAGASFGWSWNAGNKIDFSGYQKFHMHIYPSTSGTIEIYPVVAPEAEFHKVSQTLTAGQWNEIVLDYTDKTFAPLNQIGFVNFFDLGEFFIDNVYFYAEVPAKDVVRDGLSAGKWGTICPKQTVENVEGATFYQISYLEEQGGLPFNMVFDQIPGTTLTAGQPYFFVANGTQILGNKTGAELTVAGDGVNGFYGYISSTDAPMELANWHTDYDANEEYNTFIIYNNSVFRINQGGTMLNSERCYININSTEPSRGVVAPAPGLKRLNMSINGTNVTTGLNAQNVSDKLTKVIIDGQLYILREGKLYDLTGRMVK